jgi:PPE-repeat protein
MYSGPGSASILAGAAAWDAVADELYAAASGGNTVISALTSDGWLSHASMLMTVASSTYFAWLSCTAAQAQQTAVQLLMAAGAFEAALTATVPPPVIAANRGLVMLLTATNVLGINTPAIATAEAHYGEMWAQDAAAMYGYAAASAVAATLPSFTPPPEVADPAGVVDQIGAVDQASALASVTSVVPQALQQLAAPLGVASSLISPASSGASALSSSLSSMSSLSSVAKALGSSTVVASEEAAAVGSTIAGEFGVGAAAFTPGLAAAAPGVAAEVGRAVSLGQLSVPQSWATASGVASSLPRQVSAIGAASESEVGLGGAANVLGGLPFSATARGENSASSAVFRPSLPDVLRPTVVPRI